MEMFLVQIGVNISWCMDTNKVYNKELKVPGYQQSVQPGKGIPRYQQVYNLEKNVPRYQQSVHVVGILVCFPGSANLAVNLHIVSIVQ